MTNPLPVRSAEEADRALRADIHLLGTLLGETITAFGGDDLFQRVETTRRASRRLRDGDGSAQALLDEGLQGLPASLARELTRAFSTYFALANMAEQVQRIRRRRDQQQDGHPAQPGSLLAVLQTLRERGLSLEAVRASLAGMRIEPVFTAHPTRAVRRTLLAKAQRIARTLVDRLEQPAPTPHEAQRMEQRLRTEIEQIWQTGEQPMARPTVSDEVEYVLFYLSETIYRVVPGFYEALALALDAVYGQGAGDGLPTGLLRFGTWVGGDMDGNPNVGPETILATLARQREVVLRLYEGEVLRLHEQLSQSLGRARFSRAVLDLAARCARQESASRAGSPLRYEDMPYRVILQAVAGRLRATREERGPAYAGPGEFRADLATLADSLEAGGGQGAAALLRRLLRRVDTFGFHLAALDIRQDALVHRRAAGAALGIVDFAGLPAAARVDALRQALRAEPGAAELPHDEELLRCLETLRAVREARRRFGSTAVGPYIISMAQGADDALALLLLARMAGLVDAGGATELDIAPLFETVDDLDGAAATLRALLDDPLYRAHQRSRGDEQLVMLGYSDSSKISGLPASRWALHRAQEELVAIADGAGLRLSFFHGRGGTVGRGGGKPRQAILADPCGALRGRLRVTEQGEIVHAKYGLRGIAERTLELTAGAVLETSALCSPRSQPAPEWTAAMDLVAGAARADWNALVHEDPHFLDYFRSGTPIDIIERLQIGSRPAARRSGQGVADLRAIPWVFAWTQSRHGLPGWYGLAAGLAAAEQEHGLARLREMAARWPFFSTLLADVEMVLAKADMPIAARYAALAGPRGAGIFSRIAAAHGETVERVLALREGRELLEQEPALKRSIALRNPYVDPISRLQVDLLARWREGNREDRELEAALFDTVRGIARGLQNTG
jgi:phosphoenolpyruvate carboxylase